MKRLNFPTIGFVALIVVLLFGGCHVTRQQPTTVKATPFTYSMDPLPPGTVRAVFDPSPTSSGVWAIQNESGEVRLMVRARGLDGAPVNSWKEFIPSGGKRATASDPISTIRLADVGQDGQLRFARVFTAYGGHIDFQAGKPAITLNH